MISARHDPALSSTREHQRELLQQLANIAGPVLEAASRQQTASAGREAFMRDLGHELSTPVNAIVGFSSVLANRYASGLDEKAKRYLERIEHGAARLSTIVTDVVRLSSIDRQSLRTTTIDLTELVRTCIAELCARDPERRVDLAIDDGIACVGDSNLVGAAIRELVSNAWESTSGREVALIAFGVETSTSVPIFYLRDNGVGFDMDDAGKLFVPFHRVRAGPGRPGSGLGLARTQRIIARHGGRIWARAAAGEGATFYFTLARELRP